jgi:excisionase family DNA binding protein
MFMTVEEAAHALGVSPCTVREWAKAGKIPARRFGRLWRFDENEIQGAGKVECRYTDTPSPLIGGSASRLAVERFASRQAQKTERTPKSSSKGSVKSTGARLSLVSSTTHGKKRANVGFESEPESEA